MDQNPFATLISIKDNEPFISHLPLTPKRENGKIVLIGHCARANPHWKLFTTGNITVVFHGPHTYITPRWYEVNDVPTWNYLTVHAIGKVRLIEDSSGLTECLKQLSLHAEKHWPSGWEFYVPDDLQGPALQKAIVGFEIHIEQINFKKKLSQGGKDIDRAGVLVGLAGRPDDNSRGVLEEMQKLYNEDGTFKKA